MDWQILVGIVVGGGVILLLLWLCSRRKKLSQTIYQKAVQDILSTQNLAPPHAVIESHKIFIRALNVLLRTPPKTAAQTLKLTAKRFPNEKRVWYFHRLRNRIAHETHVSVTLQDADNARDTFLRALKAVS